jgi:preprotein translocase subunit SecF
VEIVRNPRFDFLGNARYCVGASSLAVLASLAFIAVPGGGLRYGIEFSGGTQVIARFERPPAVDRIRDAVGTVAKGAVIQTYGDPAKRQVLIRVGQPAAEGADLSAAADALRQALRTGYVENPVTEATTEAVGPVVGADLREKALRLTVLALFFQLLYIGWRFKGPIWGAAATVAVFHDVLVTLGLLAVLRFELTLNVIAALLTLVGFQVNDTIVVFDRVRENLRARRRDPMAAVMNDSLNQTLTRTIISNGTAFLAVSALFLFGGEVLRGFGFVMVVGILAGTYSTIFVASPLVVWWQERWGTAETLPAAAGRRRRPGSGRVTP